MSDESTQEPTAPTEPITEPNPAPAQHVDPAPEPESRPERQAARYRRELREAEKQRDKALDMLESARRAIISQHQAMERITQTARHDVIKGIDADTLESFFGENGTPDDEAITTYIADLTAKRPYMAAASRPNPDIMHIINGMKGEGTFRLKRDPLSAALRR